GHFFLGVERLGDVLRSLKWDVGGIGPEPLQIGLTVGRVRKRPALRGSRRLRGCRWGLSRDLGRRRPYQGEKEACQSDWRKNAMVHRKPPSERPYSTTHVDCSCCQ